MSSPTILKFPVSPRGSSPRTPSNKRRITPSAERSSPQHALIVTTTNRGPLTSQGEISLKPFSAPRQLFSHAHLSSQEQEDAKATWHQRHVLLPFNLRDLSNDIYKGEVRDLLYHIFPETTNVTEARWRSHLIFQVKELPKSPWPLTVGGVPFTITSHDNKGRALIFPRQTLGNFELSICQHGYKVEEFSDKELRKLGADVHSWFTENLPETRMIELMLTSERTIYVVLEDNADISSLRITLPGKIARCPVGYLTNRELRRPLWADSAAKRQVEPQPISGVIDNTAYDILRPGVLISSKILNEHEHPAVFSTTSGTLVQSESGSCFMTAASHSIGDDGDIWQGDHPGRSISEAVLEIPFTDISLVKLKNDITFVNETFENNSGDSPSFTRLATSEDRFVFDDCFLNSPYTGNMEASIVSKSVKLETSTHPTEDKLRYVIYNWCYMGQTEGNEDRIRPPDGTCGSTIWDDNGVIMGFYHYCIQEGPWNGFSASVSASELVEAGYTLAKETAGAPLPVVETPTSRD
ncbi:hypothetical protein FHL15_006098 [Xylaria flabelliformis]|uniref:Uncharacterized protein n=1 Tax=Xylaria flabelliformis TaxID=2512241 RepID=A0A553HYD5_9PEZI|nr:hypothetical protein FHL15_006098 [Xylaria flabelliformis]